MFAAMIEAMKTAIKLVEKFYHQIPSIASDKKERAWQSAKDAALIVCDEIDYYMPSNVPPYSNMSDVKNEIKKL